MAFEQQPKKEEAAVEEAHKRARWAYIKPFMDEIQARQAQREVDGDR